MAVPFREDSGLDPEVMQDLALCRAFGEFAKSSVWQSIKELMDEAVSASLNTLATDYTNDPENGLALLKRWQSRIEMRDLITKHVDSYIAALEATLQETKENEHSSPGE